MFDDILQHRRIVQDNINKAFGVDESSMEMEFALDIDLEKAHYVGDLFFPEW